jgi:GDP-L-fucose synthase
MDKNSKIFIAGHRGLAGSAIVRELQKKGYFNLVYKTSSELDLRDQKGVEVFFENEKPEYVFLCAARVGGIGANSRIRAEMIYDNLMIQSNVIHNSWKYGVEKLLFLGSSCIYPKFAPQPMKEEYLMGSPLEYSNEPYAIAKIAGLKMCEAYNLQYGTDFVSLMPTNLYGINDNFDLEDGHVLPVMLRKLHEAVKNGSESVELWGTGTPQREFLYSDDLASAALMVMEKVSFKDLVSSGETANTHINVGTGKDIAIKDLALVVAQITGFEGDVVWNTSKPDGTPRKLLDVSKMSDLGWKPEVSLEDGIRRLYEWYKENE